ncbi:MAG: hypothetical protein WCL61_03100 [bacterium]
MGGELNGLWRRVYNALGASSDHLPLRQYFSEDDLNQDSLETVVHAIVIGCYDSKNIKDSVRMKQLIEKLESGGIDIKEYRREYELRFGAEAQNKRNALVEQVIDDYALKMAMADILVQQKKSGRSEEQERGLRKEVVINKIKKVFNPFGLVSRWKERVHQKNKQETTDRLSKINEDSELSREDIDGLFDSASSRLREKFVKQ